MFYQKPTRFRTSELEVQPAGSSAIEYYFFTYIITMADVALAQLKTQKTTRKAIQKRFNQSSPTKQILQENICDPLFIYMALLEKYKLGPNANENLKHLSYFTGPDAKMLIKYFILVKKYERIIDLLYTNRFVNEYDKLNDNELLYILKIYHFTL
jgi:hypothetical protein